MIYVEPTENAVGVPGMVPCPDCLGGEQHCCDGECAQPELPASGSFDNG